MNDYLILDSQTLIIKDGEKLIGFKNSFIFNSTDFSYTEDSNHNINSITFNVEPKSSIMIRFYKKNANENKTYNGEGVPVVTFTRLS